MSKLNKPYKAQANLDVLFGDEEEITTLELGAIILPTHQPRRYFDPVKLEELTASVKALGILENLLVRPVEGGYELVAGERRYRAAQKAGLTEVPVTVRELTDAEALSISLVENLQREDLNPVEETEAILLLLSTRLDFNVNDVKQSLYQLFNVRQGKSTNNVISNEQAGLVDQVFAELGKMSLESFIVNRLPLLNLPDEILDALRQGQIEYTKAKAISLVKDEDTRTELLETAITENLSIREIKERIKALSTPPIPSPKTQIKDLASRLNQSKLWEKEPKKWKKIQGWLDKIEELLQPEPEEQETGINKETLSVIFEESEPQEN